MSAASRKFDYPTRGFPARTLLNRTKEGAGHWLVAHRRAEKQKHKTRYVMHRKYKNDKYADSPQGNTLDRLFLLRLHCVDEPSELCSVNIRKQNLTSVESEELKMFDNVAYIDASINLLSLASFSSFVSLRELTLSLNGLHNMAFEATDFPHLKVLDLSYNNVSSETVVHIGRLPCLKVLHLTGNNLHHLPPNLASSNPDPTAPFDQKGAHKFQIHDSLILVNQLQHNDLQYTCFTASVGAEDSQFKCLEVLMLDDNKLSSCVFNSLAHFKRLKNLNLEGNHISRIPYLQPMEKSFIEEQAEEEEALALNEPNPSADDHFQRLSQIFPQEDFRRSSLPFPQLQVLNLAHNKIAEEDAVMAVSLFPNLQEIDICSNPLTTQRSGDPPLLTYYLQERLGIAIKRQVTEKAVKFPLIVSTDPKWKVEERKSKVSKKMLEIKTPCPAQSQVGKREKTDKETPVALQVIQEDAQHFFVTQATDGPQFGIDLQQTAENKNTQEDDTISKKLTCYEMLTDTKPKPHVVKPVGIQTAVRELERALKNLNVNRESKPQLDSIQTLYRGREKRIKDLPPLKPIKKPTDEILKEIKGRTTITKVPLSVNKKDYKKAQLLWEDLITNYKMCYERALRQIAGIESDGDTNQNKAEPPPVQKL